MSWVFDEEVLAVIAAIILVAAVFAAAQAFYTSRVIEPFSELGLLGPAGKIGDYLKEIIAGSPLHLNIYIGNHEGKAIYYRVLVKVGDQSSIINASTPLDAEPIIDIRAVLGHGSSKVIPVDITFYKPAINARLVFEMWVYDELTGLFKYHGRWNQLWINVTGQVLSVSPQRDRAISPDIEPMIAEAYLAIRRAEDAGGDVSVMIRLLNMAIEYASGGNTADAQRLIKDVLLLEPEVARTGAEAVRMRLYMTICSITALSSICVALYIYLRRNIWLLWAKAHKEWRVVRRNEGQRNQSRRNSIRHEKRSENDAILSDEVTVNDLLRGPRALSPDARKAARELYRIVRSGEIRLIDPNPPRSFLSYLVSRYNLGFISALIILMLGVACIYLSEGFSGVQAASSPPLISAFFAAITFMRYALGSIMVLFLPGYSLVETLYPSGDELSPLERLALSIGLSLALAPLVGLVLNYTPWGIKLNPIMFSLIILTLLLLLISAYRKFTLARR
ncbi:MAG: DUF1616 domain-containing protein [Candidatus Bathyarchaeia archaeon]